jgi:hypothetical protein
VLLCLNLQRRCVYISNFIRCSDACTFCANVCYSALKVVSRLCTVMKEWWSGGVTYAVNASSCLSNPANAAARRAHPLEYLHRCYIGAT